MMYRNMIERSSGTRSVRKRRKTQHTIMIDQDRFTYERQ